MVTFFTLIWLGRPSIAPNAASTVAIRPGSLGNLWNASISLFLENSSFGKACAVRNPPPFPYAVRCMSSCAVSCNP